MWVRFLKFVFLGSVALIAVSVQADPDQNLSEAPYHSLVTGVLTPTDPVQPGKRYLFKHQEFSLPQGGRRSWTEYSEEGTKEPLVTENAYYNAKGEILSYEMDHHQIKEYGKVQFGEKELQFFLKNKKGTTTDKDDRSEYAGTIDQLTRVIPERWKDLMDDESIKVDLAIVSRKETVSVKLFKDDEITYEGKPAVRVKMKPRSIIIAMFLKPMYMVFEKAPPHRVLEIEGRMPVKYFDDSGDYHDILGTLKLKY